MVPKTSYSRVIVILLILISCLFLFRDFDSSIIHIATLTFQVINSFILFFLVFILYF